jgi:hypothetical protein
MRRPSARRARALPACVALIGSATPASPAAWPSTATNITVWPSRAAPRPRAASGPGRRPSVQHQRGCRARPSAVDLPCDTLAGHRLEGRRPRQGSTPRSSAPATIAAPADARCPARGWRPGAAASPPSKSARRLHSHQLRLALGERAGLVDDQRVDLAQHLDRLGVAKQHAHRGAAAPVATMIDIGVASPSAQGQAMISTATALTRACARRGSGPRAPRAAKVSAAMPAPLSTK